MHKILILLIVLLMEVKAGWYEVYQFNGMIGKYPIELFIQKNKENLSGIYKYKKFNTAIALTGTIKGKNIEIFVMDKGKKTEKFTFDFSKQRSTGTWHNLTTKKSMPLTLKLIQTLDDRNKNVFDNKRILQSASFRNYYFVGVYMHEKNSYVSARMCSLEIIDKKSNKILQEIDFTSLDVPVGNIRTIIFDHVEYIDEKNKTFDLWNGMGRMGGIFSFYWDKKQKKFLRKKEVHVEGVGSFMY